MTRNPRTPPDMDVAVVVAAEQAVAAHSSAQRRFPERAAAAAGAAEAVVLRTCTRTEIYLAATEVDRVARTVRGELGGAHGRRPSLRVGSSAVRHLFAVSSGLESPIIGESDILRQVRQAWSLARRGGSAGPLLNRLFRDAVHTGKRVRAETEIGHGAVSYAAAAVAALAAEGARLDGARAVVVGAGAIGTSVARTLRSRGATIVVASRTRTSADRLACRCNGSSIALDELGSALDHADVVIAAATADRFLITPEMLAARGSDGRGPVVIVDVGSPANVDPGVAEHCTLIDLQALVRIAAAAGEKRSSAAEAATRIVDDELERFERWLTARAVVPELTLLRRRAHAVVEEELRRDAARLARLSEEDRRAVEALAGRVVNSLLHLPTVRLKEDGASAAGRRYAEAIRHLFADEAA